MSDTVIKTVDLKKRYGRKKDAVKGISLDVKKGSVYAFLGRNGAGKSTTIRMMLGLLEQTSGSIEILGMDPFKKPVEIKNRIGYVGENQKMYDWMTIEETISFASSFHSQWDSKFCDELLQRFALDEKIKLKNLSRGMYAQVALILAISHHPELLILDDPTSGLDTVVRREFMEEVIGVLHERDCTVFFSTHIIPEIENIADHIGIMNQGELLVSMKLEKLKKSIKQIKLIFKDEVPGKISLPNTLKKDITNHEVIFTIKDFNDQTVNDAKSYNPLKCEVIDMTLEDIFIALA